MRRREVTANPSLGQVTRRRQNAVSTCRSLPGGRYVKRRILRTRGKPSALLRYVTLDVGEGGFEFEFVADRGEGGGNTATDGRVSETAGDGGGCAVSAVTTASCSPSLVRW